MDEGAGGGEVGRYGVALTEMAGSGGEVEAEGGGGSCAGGGDGERAGGISGEAVHAVLEGSREGVELGERWKGAGGRREVEYLI